MGAKAGDDHAALTRMRPCPVHQKPLSHRKPSLLVLSCFSRATWPGLASPRLAVAGKQDAEKIRKYIEDTMLKRIMTIDGAMGTTIQQYKFNEADFRAHVSGFQPAHPKHGGGGAFYVWLRRKR